MSLARRLMLLPLAILDLRGDGRPSVSGAGTPWLMGTYPGFGTRTMSEEALALAVDVAGDVEVCLNCRDMVEQGL